MSKPIVARRKVVWLTLCLAWLVVSLAGVSETPAATFVRVAPGVISLKGLIELGDCERWNDAAGADVKTVLLNSAGGRNGQGECISRSIAAKHLRTVVLEKCSSICFLLFAAGRERVVCEDGRIGVHRPRDVESSQESDDPKFLNAILDYARRYHVPEAILQKLSDTPSRSIYLLTPDDLASMGVKDCR